MSATCASPSSSHFRKGDASFRVFGNCLTPLSLSLSLPYPSSHSGEKDPTQAAEEAGRRWVIFNSQSLVTLLAPRLSPAAPVPSAGELASVSGRVQSKAAKQGRGMASLFVLLLLVTAATASPAAPEEESGTHSVHFQRWMAVHGRSYTAEELPYRRSVYEQNMRRIKEFNAQAAAAGRTYVLGEGPFTDLTEEEFARQLTSTRRSSAAGSSRRTHHVVAADEVAVPTSVDWRQAGAVTPVKAQGPCGSCWAFAAVAAIESLLKIQSGELVSLSEQQLLDCSAGGTGCVGGFAWMALQWIVANGGIAAEGSYPYTGTTGVCRLADHAATLSGFRFVDSYSEKTLMSVVAMQPVVVSIAVNGGSNIQHYKSGIYNGPCIIGPADHDLIIVGYGQDEEGKSYWIAKNSWGVSWGDGGYIYIEKDVKQQPWGLCGLAVKPVYPVM